MGILKDNKKYDYLMKYGFHYDKSPIDSSIHGYLRVFNHCRGLYDLWVTVCPSKKIVQMYNEYSCGGEVFTRVVDFPSDIDINDEESFIGWLDDLITANTEL